VILMVKKKEGYRERWLREHHEVRLYLSRDDYEFLRGLADRSGKSFRELLLDALRGLRECVSEEDVLRDVLNFIDKKAYMIWIVCMDKGVRTVDECCKMFNLKDFEFSICMHLFGLISKVVKKYMEG